MTNANKYKFKYINKKKERSVADEYYDIPITLKMVISVKGKDREEASEKLYNLTEKEVIKLVSEQIDFVGDNIDISLPH